MTRLSTYLIRVARKICAPAILSFVALSGADAGSISGRITAADGTAIDAALTLHDLSTARVAGKLVFDHQFSSKKDGTFALSGVPAATYEICVDAPHLQVLDPCRWGGSTKKVTVPAGGAVTGFDLTLQRGYLLKVRVNDPAQAVPTAAGGIAGPTLQMAVQTLQGRYENLRLQGIDATGRTHYLVIPFNTPLLLAASSSGLALSDTNNQRYTKDSTLVPIVVPAGGSIPVVTFNVAKPQAVAN
jgi:hypothetical protein